MLSNSHIAIDFVEGSRLIGAGLSTIGVTGAGIGIGTIFAGFVLAQKFPVPSSNSTSASPRTCPR